MTTAAMATMATVDAAKSTRPCYPSGLSEKPTPRAEPTGLWRGEHREVSVKRDPLKATHTEWHQPVLVPQSTKLALDRRAAPVRFRRPVPAAVSSYGRS